MKNGLAGRMARLPPDMRSTLLASRFTFFFFSLVHARRALKPQELIAQFPRRFLTVLGPSGNNSNAVSVFQRESKENTRDVKPCFQDC